MTTQKLYPVPWHSEPVYILGLGKDSYPTENGFQVYTADWIRSLRLPCGSLLNEKHKFHHSANENRGKGLAGQIAGSEAKRKGQSPGFPDWLCPSLELALELKLPGQKPTPDQQSWLAHFSSIGWHSEVVYSFERFREIVLAKLE